MLEWIPAARLPAVTPALVNPIAERAAIEAAFI